MRRTSVCSVADDENTARVETRQGLGGEVEETPLISMINYPWFINSICLELGIDSPCPSCLWSDAAVFEQSC
jgi:hypothetical protein